MTAAEYVWSERCPSAKELVATEICKLSNLAYIFAYMSVFWFLLELVYDLLLGYIYKHIQLWEHGISLQYFEVVWEWDFLS